MVEFALLICLILIISIVSVRSIGDTVSLNMALAGVQDCNAFIGVRVDSNKYEMHCRKIVSGRNEMESLGIYYNPQNVNETWGKRCKLYRAAVNVTYGIKRFILNICTTKGL